MAAQRRGATGQRNAPATSPEQLEEVEEAFAEISQDAILIIERLDPDEKRWGFVCKMAPDEFTIEAVAERYGGGRFRAKSRVPDENNVFRWGTQRTFFIDDKVVPLEGADDPLGGEGEGGGGFAGLVNRSFIQLFQLQMEMMKTQMHRPSPLQELVRDIGPLVIPSLVEKMLSKRDDPLELMEKVAGMLQGLGGGRAGIEELRQVYRDGMEDGKELGGDGGDPSIEMMRHVADALKSLTQGGPGIVRPPETRHPTDADAYVPSWAGSVRGYEETIINLERMRMRPELAAEFILDQMPDGVIDKIAGDVVSPRFLHDAQHAFPRLFQSAPTWAGAVLEKVQELILEDLTGPGGEPSEDPPQVDRGPSKALTSEGAATPTN